MDDPLNITWPIQLHEWTEKYAKEKGYKYGYSRTYINSLKHNYPDHEISRKEKSDFDKNNYILNNLLLKVQEPETREKNVKRLQEKVKKLEIEKENKEGIEKELVVSPELLQVCEYYLNVIKAIETFNKYEFGTRMRENLWRPPTEGDKDDSGGPMYKKFLSHYETLQSRQGKTKKKINKKGGKHSSKSKRSSKKKHNKKHKRKTKSKTRK